MEKRKKTTTKKRAALSLSQKQKIKKSYRRAINSVDKGDVDYVLKKTQRKLKEISKKKSHLTLFFMQVKLLGMCLKDSTKRVYRLPWKIIAAITAALLYVINPWDIIPDFIPVVGYVDDALVIALCLKLVRSELLDYCDFKGIDPVEYGIA